MTDNTAPGETGSPSKGTGSSSPASIYKDATALVEAASTRSDGTTAPKGAHIPLPSKQGDSLHTTVSPTAANDAQIRARISRMLEE